MTGNEAEGTQKPPVTAVGPSPPTYSDRMEESMELETLRKELEQGLNLPIFRTTDSRTGSCLRS